MNPIKKKPMGKIKRTIMEDAKTEARSWAPDTCRCELHSHDHAPSACTRRLGIKTYAWWKPEEGQYAIASTMIVVCPHCNTLLKSNIEGYTPVP